jgi:hypothetical protein
MAPGVSGAGFSSFTECVTWLSYQEKGSMSNILTGQIVGDIKYLLHQVKLLWSSDSPEDAMQNDKINATPPTSQLVGWFQELLRGPVTPTGDYFERLQFSVAASAPECSSCA